MWGFCLHLSMSIPARHSRPGERAAAQVQGPTVRRVQPELNSLDPLTSTSLCSDQGDVLGPLEVVSFQSQS